MRTPTTKQRTQTPPARYKLLGGHRPLDVTKMQDDLYVFDQNMEDLYYEATTMVVLMTIDTC
jgi:hypothetical protein